MSEKTRESRRSLTVMEKVVREVNHEGKRSGKRKDSWLKIPPAETFSLHLLMGVLQNHASENRPEICGSG